MLTSPLSRVLPLVFFGLLFLPGSGLAQEVRILRVGDTFADPDCDFSRPRDAWESIVPDPAVDLYEIRLADNTPGAHRRPISLRGLEDPDFKDGVRIRIVGGFVTCAPGGVRSELFDWNVAGLGLETSVITIAPEAPLPGARHIEMENLRVRGSRVAQFAVAGGALHATAGILSLQRVHFVDNVAAGGGAIFLATGLDGEGQPMNVPSLRLASGVVFRSNGASVVGRPDDARGGALRCLGARGHRPFVEGELPGAENNQATVNGTIQLAGKGGFIALRQCDVRLEAMDPDRDWARNRAGEGGAVYVARSSLQILGRGNEVAYNTALGRGGAFFVDSQDEPSDGLRMAGLELRNNVAESGGALAVFGSPAGGVRTRVGVGCELPSTSLACPTGLELTHWVNNRGTVFGGAVFVQSDASVEIAHSFFRGNYLDSVGGHGSAVAVSSLDSTGDRLPSASLVDTVLWRNSEAGGEPQGGSVLATAHYPGSGSGPVLRLEHVTTYNPGAADLVDNFDLSPVHFASSVLADGIPLHVVAENATADDCGVYSSPLASDVLVGWEKSSLADIAFAGLEAADLHLTGASNAIDRCAGSHPTSLVDADGDARGFDAPQAGATGRFRDAGADELVPRIRFCAPAGGIPPGEFHLPIGAGAGTIHDLDVDVLGENETESGTFVYTLERGSRSVVLGELFGTESTLFSDEPNLDPALGHDAHPTIVSSEPLAAFDGMPLSGTWTLQVAGDPDPDTVLEGWCLVAATAAGPILFADGFESGDTRRWSAVSP